MTKRKTFLFPLSFTLSCNLNFLNGSLENVSGARRKQIEVILTVSFEKRLNGSLKWSKLKRKVQVKMHSKSDVSFNPKMRNKYLIGRVDPWPAMGGLVESLEINGHILCSGARLQVEGVHGAEDVEYQQLLHPLGRQRRDD
jgi:hypothetical protein